MLLSKLPSGMRYYLGAEARDCAARLKTTAMSVFEGWSYEEVLTPSVDYYALFEQGMGVTEAQSSFRPTDSDGRMLSLRPDVTSSVARVAATLLAESKGPCAFATRRLSFGSNNNHMQSGVAKTLNLAAS